MHASNPAGCASVCLALCCSWPASFLSTFHMLAVPQAAAAFIFFNFLLSVAATMFAVKAIDEIKAKQREEYNRFTVLSDTLQYEADAA